MPRIMYIERVYAAATEGERSAGVGWYPIALKACERLAERFDVPVCMVVGIVAALSPNNRWKQNLSDAQALLQAYKLYGGHPVGLNNFNASTYPAMKRKAWMIRACDSTPDMVVERLNGPKITAFYRNIMGEDCVTVDGHAKNIYYGKREPLKGSNMGRKEFDLIAKAYEAAGIKHGVTASQMQAITWVAWRRLQGIA